MRRFTSAAQLQRFASVHGIVQTLFRVGRHLLRSAHPRLLRTRAFVEWESHRVGQPWARACRGGSALSPREIDTPDRTQQAHVTASCRGTQPCVTSASRARPTAGRGETAETRPITAKGPAVSRRPPMTAADHCVALRVPVFGHVGPPRRSCATIRGPVRICGPCVSRGAQTGSVPTTAAPQVRSRELMPGGAPLCGGASHEAEG